MKELFLNIQQARQAPRSSLWLMPSSKGLRLPAIFEAKRQSISDVLLQQDAVMFGNGFRMILDAPEPDDPSKYIPGTWFTPGLARGDILTAPHDDPEMHYHDTHHGVDYRRMYEVESFADVIRASAGNSSQTAEGCRVLQTPMIDSPTM